ncbi:MAG: entericidin EcnAB [Erythrobacter sp.]|nr:entericidin EcnAB [Erythrobacter sp.]
MKRMIATSLAAATLLGLAACSDQTQEDAARTADLAGDDIEANAEVAGEVLEQGAKEAAGAVAEGASNLERHIEENDTETPGPAPVLGDELNADRADPNE